MKLREAVERAVKDAEKDGIEDIESSLLLVETKDGVFYRFVSPAEDLRKKEDLTVEEVIDAVIQSEVSVFQLIATGLLRTILIMRNTRNKDTSEATRKKIRKRIIAFVEEMRSSETL